MHTVARNALRVSLAGAGILVVGASYVGHASAEESRDDTGSTETGTTASPVAVPTLPAPQYLLSPESLDSFVLPTVSDTVGL